MYHLFYISLSLLVIIKILGVKCFSKHYSKKNYSMFRLQVCQLHKNSLWLLIERIIISELNINLIIKLYNTQFVGVVINFMYVHKYIHTRYIAYQSSKVYKVNYISRLNKIIMVKNQKINYYVNNIE